MMEDRKESTPQTGESRRDVMKKMAYAAPLVISLAASPAFASSGSARCPKRGESTPDKPGSESVNNRHH
jgi:hypothetical protein